MLPLLLCASVPPVPQPERVVDKLIPKLSATAGLDLGSTVEQRIRLAWQDAWEEQATVRAAAHPARAGGLSSGPQPTMIAGPA